MPEPEQIAHAEAWCVQAYVATPGGEPGLLRTTVLEEMEGELRRAGARPLVRRARLVLALCQAVSGCFQVGSGRSAGATFTLARRA